MSDLKSKLKEKMALQKLGRTSRVIREKKAEELEKKKKLSESEKKLKRRLEDIEDKEFSALPYE